MHQQPVTVSGLGQVVQALGQGHAAFGDPGLVVVQVDIAVVDRHHAVTQGHGRRAVQRGIWKGFDHLSSLGLEHQRVVDTKHHVGHRLGAGEDQLVEHLTSVSALDDAELDIGLGLKLRQHGLGQGERAVHHDTQLVGCSLR